MLHIVAYDIKDAKRLKKLSRLCLDYGVRIQYSIFEFDLNADLTKDFLQKISEIIDSAVDKVMVVPVCENCRKSIKLLGQAKTFELPVLFLI